jgi:arabinogalactan endo-1,4-beta-galactosidase
MRLKYLLSVIIVLFISETNLAEIQNINFIIKGIDASFIPELRSLNILTYDKNSQVVDMLDLIKSSGINTIRIRLWHTPSSIHSSFNEVKAFSDEVRNKGLKVYLNLHYSDTWADPGHQSKPEAWNNLSFDQLKDSIYVYTKNVASYIQPDYIQIGNEINSGILFPEGGINNLNQFKQLIQKGIQAVRESSPSSKIILHYAGYSYAVNFYSNINDLDYDIIGLSYYPFWHGKSLTELQNTLNSLSNNFNKEIIIAEAAYPFDSLNGTQNYLVNGYPATIEGQTNYIKKINSIVMEISNGTGVCLWGGVTEAYKIPKPTPNGYYWENQAVLDYNNKFLPVLESLNNISSVKYNPVIPNGFSISSYPNPFNNSTNIQYKIPISADVILELYNNIGEKIKILYSGYQSAGQYNSQFNGDDLASGMYFVVLKTPQQILTCKILLLK